MYVILTCVAPLAKSTHTTEDALILTFPVNHLSAKNDNDKANNVTLVVKILLFLGIQDNKEKILGSFPEDEGKVK